MGDRGGRGAPYHVVVNLIGWAATNWDEIDGVLLLRGVDLWNLPLDRACSVLWALAMEGRDLKERAKMQASLERPHGRLAERARDDLFNDEDARMFAAAEMGMGGMFG